MRIRVHFLIIITGFFLTTISNVIGQHKTISSPFNTIYFELGGNGLFTSINYERRLIKNTRLDLHIGAGIYGVVPYYVTIPVGVNYLINLHDESSYIDLGFAATYCKTDVSLYAIVEHRNPNYVNSNYWNYIPSVAYRINTKRKMMYRLAFTPVFNHNGFLPFVGFSIGKGF